MPTILQNVIFPTAKDPDTLPLFIDAEINSFTGRTNTRVRAGQRVSFASYFNAFPASYWQRWTDVKEISLTLETSGAGTVIIYRSNSSGAASQVHLAEVGGENNKFSYTLPLNVFSDGGWYWFDVIAGGKDLTLHAGSWSTEAKAVTPGKLSLGMTTFNKPDYCVATLENISENETLVAEIDKIFLVDQGNKKVADEDGFDTVAKKLGKKLRVINQANLGGSGGFSRAMAETLTRDKTEYLLLLDDDIEFETESALRALQFSRYSSDPIIVGGHMFDLHNKPVMHAWAEIVDPEPFMWGPSFKEQHRHDFRAQNLRDTSWMHARLDADYNGWWMSMIPKKVIAEIGLSIPVFIKWDDAEYGLRAKAAGYRTVSLPGVALWHVSWLDKDDTQDWQAYFHTRNRLIAGLLHSNYAKGGKLLQNSGRQDIKKLLNMQYYAVQLAVDALQDVLKGPKGLHREMAESMPKARAKAKNFLETRVYLPSDTDTPVSQNGRAIPSLNPDPLGPTGLQLALFTVKNTFKHWTWSGSEKDQGAPEFEYPKQEAFWWVIPKHKSVLVGTADGTGKMWFRHDQRKFRKLLRKSRRLTNKIAKNWDSLARAYRAELKTMTSVESWQKTFAEKV